MWMQKRCRHDSLIVFLVDQIFCFQKRATVVSQYVLQILWFTDHVYDMYVICRKSLHFLPVYSVTATEFDYEIKIVL